MDPEIVNIYIAKLLREVEELTKNRILMQTQLQYTEGLNKSLSDRIQELEEQLEKSNKKINKKQEVNTSLEQF